MTHPVTLLQVLTLIVVANAAPIAARRVFRDYFSYPLDCGVRLPDGGPLLGRTKTIRGILSSLIVTTTCAPIVGLGWEVGLTIGLTAMAGDLLSSFLKRRLRFPESSMALGFDQIPESLFPLLACQRLLQLTFLDVIVGVVAFFISELALSRLSHILGIRRHPY